MDYIAELAAIAKEHGGIIETKIAAQHGISKAMLYKLCKEDRIHRGHDLSGQESEPHPDAL